jgi:tripartite-type tricarboxylate transporter receptor subunit TctC
MTMLPGAAPAQEPTYPSRPITLVVGLAAGSGQDTAAPSVGARASSPSYTTHQEMAGDRCRCGIERE